MAKPVSYKKDKSPILVVENGDWKWEILKINRCRKDAMRYQSAMCKVTSPFTLGGGEMGDTYLSDIPGFVWNGKEYIYPGLDNVT